MKICWIVFLVLLFSCELPDINPQEINVSIEEIEFLLQEELDDGVAIEELLSKYRLYYFYGRSYAGGYIYHVDTVENYCLIVGTEALKATDKETYGMPVTSTAIGEGSKNTLINNKDGSLNLLFEQVRGVAINGYNDWYMPSIDELEYLLSRQIPIGMPILDNNGYFKEISYEDFIISSTYLGTSGNVTKQVIQDDVYVETLVNYDNVMAVQVTTIQYDDYGNTDADVKLSGEVVETSTVGLSPYASNDKNRIIYYVRKEKI